LWKSSCSSPSPFVPSECSCYFLETRIVFSPLSFPKRTKCHSCSCFFSGGLSFTLSSSSRLLPPLQYSPLLLFSFKQFPISSMVKRLQRPLVQNVPFRSSPVPSLRSPPRFSPNYSQPLRAPRSLKSHLNNRLTPPFAFFFPHRFLPLFFFRPFFHPSPQLFPQNPFSELQPDRAAAFWLGIAAMLI